MPNCFFGKQDVNVALLSDEEMDITAQLALKKAQIEILYSQAQSQREVSNIAPAYIQGAQAYPNSDDFVIMFEIGIKGFNK